MLNQRVTLNRVYGNETSDSPQKYFWRVESTCWQSSDGSPVAAAHFERWFILRRTPRGVWLVPEYYAVSGSKFHEASAEKDKRLVILGTRKAWAYPTKAEAWKSFQIRQVRRVQHAQWALTAARAVKKLSDSVTPEGV
jgi:hypothetical protein